MVGGGGGGVGGGGGYTVFEPILFLRIFRKFNCKLITEEFWYTKLQIT